MTAAAPHTGRNTVGALTGLTALFPIRHGTLPSADTLPDRSVTASLRSVLAALPSGVNSTFTSVPNTYFSRLYILEDLPDEHFHPSLVKRAILNLFRRNIRLDHLQSHYLVWATDFHGTFSPYLEQLRSLQSPLVVHRAPSFKLVQAKFPPPPAPGAPRAPASTVGSSSTTTRLFDPHPKESPKPSPMTIT